jgi:hypothetical protein
MLHSMAQAAQVGSMVCNQLEEAITQELKEVVERFSDWDNQWWNQGKKLKWATKIRTRNQWQFDNQSTKSTFSNKQKQWQSLRTSTKLT